MYSVKSYLIPFEFWSEISPVLRKEETKNSLLLGLANIFLRDPSGCVSQTAIFKDSQLLGALVCSQYLTIKNLVFSPLKDKATLAKLLVDFNQIGLPFNGVIAEKNTSDLVRQLIAEDGFRTRILMEQGLYRCRQVNMPNVSKGIYLREATITDAPLVAKWMTDFHIESVSHDPPRDELGVAKGKIESQMIYLLEDNGEVVATVGWSRDIGTSCSVNAVFTPKKFRRRGYGSIATAKLTQLLLDQKDRVEISLYTDLSNSTSNKIYQNIGYEFVCHSTYFEKF